MTATGSPMTNDDDRESPDVSRTRNLAGELGVALLLIVGIDLFALGFIAAERTLYRADRLAYWSYASRLANDLVSDLPSAMSSIAWSVANSELNLLPATPIAAALAVVGDSRAAYVLAVLTIYGAAVIGALLLAVRFSFHEGRRLRSVWVVAGVMAAVLLFPTLWRPVFVGYLGLGGVALGVVILAIYFHGDPVGGSWKRLALVGFLTAVLALFRRWYTLWTAAFFLVVIVDAVWASARVPRPRIGKAARAPLVVGGAAAATLLALAAPVTFDRLGSGYGEEFAAFTHHGSVAGRAVAVVGEFGLLPLGLVMAAAVLLGRSGATRRIAVLLPLHALLTYLLMIRVQDHSTHHWYLYLAVFLMLAAFGIVGFAKANPPAVAVPAVVTVVVTGMLATSAVFVVGAAPVADLLGPLAPGARVRPAQRADLAEVERLLAYLDALNSRRPGYIYVVGCSDTLSEQTLAFANRSLGTEYASPHVILRSSNVDRRDGFPSSLLDAWYVVVPDPVQINMRPEDQQVVVMPNRSFLEGSDLALAFERLPEVFEFENGVRVSVFERRRLHTTAELRQFSDRLRERYPDRPDIYLPPTPPG
jgi:hypothetical protein